MKSDVKLKKGKIMALLTKPETRLPSLMEDFFRNMNEPMFGGSSVPSVNVKDEKDNYKIEVAAPGLKKDDFNIEVNNDVLTISSEKKDEKKDEDKNYTRREFNYQAFQRSFTLPPSVDADNIDASYDNGVLEVKVPKKEEAKKESKKIDIK